MLHAQSHTGRTQAHMHSRTHSGTHAQSYTQWHTCTVVHTVVHMHSRQHSGTHAQSSTQWYTCTVVHMHSRTHSRIHAQVLSCVCVCPVGCVGAIRTSCLCPRTIYAQVFYTGKGGMHKLHACQTSTLVLDIYCVCIILFVLISWL